MLVDRMNLTDLTWNQVEALSRDTPVVIPVAALEQHGRHLPVFTDSMLLGEVVRRVSEWMADRVLFAPLTWLGNSDHHIDFGGTLSAAPRLYLDLLVCLAENFLRQGFRRLVFVNGHGGNIVPGQQALFEVRQRYRDLQDLLLLFTSYWNFHGPAPDLSGFEQKQVGHACEWETSMILRLAPHLVGDFAACETIPPGGAFEPAYRAWITRDRTAPGHIGAPSLATAEKGEKLFELFAGHFSTLLERVLGWDGSTWR
jgi:creatinine amidohydrolase